MTRRAFITSLGGAMAAWPLAARAQQGERMRRVGVLTGLTESDPGARAWPAAFEEGLQKLGWSQGRNLRIDYRWAAGDGERMRSYAVDFALRSNDRHCSSVAWSTADRLWRARRSRDRARHRYVCRPAERRAHRAAGSDF